MLYTGCIEKRLDEVQVFLRYKGNKKLYVRKL